MTSGQDQEEHEQRRELFRKAIRSNDLSAARGLLSNGLLQNPPMGSVALAKAAQKDDAALVKMLLSAGVDPNKAASHGESPVYLAALNGNARALVALLDGGADPSHTLTNSPILAAASNPPILEILIERGAKLDAVTSSGQTALHRAIMLGNAKSAQLLLQANAPVDVVDNMKATPLHEAARVNFPEVTAQLLKRGADTEKLDGLGRTPALLAAHDGHLEIFHTLIAGGANLQARDAFSCGALEQALMSSLDDAAVELLTKYPALAPSAQDLDKALVIAVRNDCLKATKLLVDMGADVGQKADGRPLIQCAPDDAEELKRYLRAVKSGELIASAMADREEGLAATGNSHAGPVL